VQQQSTVFHDFVKRVPWHVFGRLVRENGCDELVRSFTARHQLLAVLFGQLSGASSLRDIKTTMESHVGLLRQAGAKVPAKSTFADANRLRPARIFIDLLAHVMKSAQRKVRQTAREAIRLIDSTSLPLAGPGTKWAYFSSLACGAKAHFVYDPAQEMPVFLSMSPANVNDITVAKTIPIETGASYVFDLGYYDYGYWAELDARGCRIVTRFKTNTPLCEPRDLPLDPTNTSDIKSDRIGFLPARQAKNRHNPMQAPVREIQVVIPTGKTLRLLTNDLDAPAQEIADLYKMRWEIELYFRMMKQTLKIRHFIGRSENAVQIQIAVATIAYCLLRGLQTSSKDKLSFLDTTRLVRSNLMFRKDSTCLLRSRPKPPIGSPQFQLCLDMT
jgi:Transposase DDE domain/Domain of unknown function (DUF4372)